MKVVDLGFLYLVLFWNVLSDDLLKLKFLVLNLGINLGGDDFGKGGGGLFGRGGKVNELLLLFFGWLIVESCEILFFINGCVIIWFILFLDVFEFMLLCEFWRDVCDVGFFISGCCFLFFV